MIRKKVALVLGGLLFVSTIGIAVIVLVCYMPQAWAMKKQAAERAIRVHVVDRDTNEPIADARVRVYATYPAYSPSLLANVRSDHRGYLLDTDEHGVAAIPLTYFLIRGLHCDRVLFPFIRNVRFADLPAHAEIHAWHDDYTIASRRIGRGSGMFLETYEQDDVIEIELRKASLLNTTSGLLSDTDGHNSDGFGPTPTAVFYYRIDPDKEAVVKTRVEEQADFAVHYKTLLAGEEDFDHGVPTGTGDGLACKVVWSVEAFGKGGVACDPTAPRRFEDLGEAAHLDYQRSLMLPALSERPRFTLAVIRSKDGERHAAVTVGRRRMGWVYPKGESVFLHGRRHNEHTASHLGRDCRQYHPTSRPAHRHW